MAASSLHSGNTEIGRPRDESGVRPSFSLLEQSELAGTPGEVCGMSDRGRVRPKNEDQFLVAELERALCVQSSSVNELVGSNLTDAPQGRMMIVADGMGGYGNGDVASSIAVSGLARYGLAVMPWLLSHSIHSTPDLERALSDALQHCHRAIRATAKKHGLDERMGTTVTMAYVTWPELHIAHAGDSRAYLLREGQLFRVTHDHTLAAELVKQGAITEEEAEHTRFSHVLVNSVGGTTQNVQVELHTRRLRKGDQLLLCSDGLTGPVDDATIAELLREGAPIEDTVQALIDAANGAGGQDNITAVLARF